MLDPIDARTLSEKFGLRSDDVLRLLLLGLNRVSEHASPHHSVSGLVMVLRRRVQYGNLVS